MAQLVKRPVSYGSYKATVGKFEKKLELESMLSLAHGTKVHRSSLSCSHLEEQ